MSDAMRPRLLVIALSLPALWLVACGGDEADDFQVRASTTMSVASPPIAKAQFVEGANQICREAWVEVRENLAKHMSRQDMGMSARARFADTVRTPFLAGIDFFIFDYIRRLGAPPGQAAEIEAIIGPFQESVELGQRRVRLFSVEQVEDHFRVYNQRARRYGLDDCLVSEARLRSLGL